VKVLFNLLDAGVGGGQRVAFHVGRELVQRGHELGVVVPGPGPALAWFEELGAKTAYIDVTSLNHPQTVAQAARLARGYDMVYSHTSVPGVILAGAAAAISRRPSVVHQHIYPHFSTRAAQRRVQEALFRAALRRATVIAVANHVADHLARVGVPRERIAVIPNAVPLPLENPAALETSDRVRIGLLGRLDPQKGAATFIEAAALAGHAQEISFRIGVPRGAVACDGNDLGRVASEAGVEIVELDHGGEAFLKDLDVVAIPSRYEGSPLVMFEAMGLRKAIVASDIPGIREVIAPDAGMLVSVDDAPAFAQAFEELAADRSLRIRFGDRAREVVEAEHDFNRMLDCVCSVIEGAAR
jgi:glycosyltransferase involved in cell wall biosynthesis